MRQGDKPLIEDGVRPSVPGQLERTLDTVVWFFGFFFLVVFCVFFLLFFFFVFFFFFFPEQSVV